ncbi:DegV family protein [Enterococcus nangangensis]|uniref:DegV family protein n=1 Tax=Enterococcus nangangensis TaxID=2559926 RepID=UPI0010F6BB14|nr:DegV family protein [Enterococcus nangangensis]
MTKVKIVTDSACTMDPELIKKLNLTVVPLSVMVEGVIYTADESFDNAGFMDLMSASKSLPKTSQPPIGLFAETYDELTKDGSEVLSIHMTERLSGTVEAARQASHLAKGKVTVVDSQFIDQSLAHQVIRAAEMAQAGAGLTEILAEIKNIQEHSKLFIGISTLENLVKGGRISRATGIVTSLLNVKVVMELKNGNLLPETKGRGKKTFFKWLDGLKKELAQEKVVRLGISYAGNPSIAEELASSIKEVLPDLPIPILHTNPVVATHAGNEAFAIMYYTA